MKNILLEYARYNLWANTQLISLFETCDDTLIETEIVSSFPSIRKTLLHLWDVEVLWLERLKGHSPTSFPSKDFEGTNADIYILLKKSSQNLVDFIAAQPDEYFNNTLTFTILSANGTMQNIPSDMIWHCINHQTFHRGQLVTMGRQVGMTAFPRTDFIIFKRENAV